MDSDRSEQKEALRNLCRAVEKHRLCFLYFADIFQRKPLMHHGMPYVPVRDNTAIPYGPGVCDENGEFLFTYRRHLDLYAQAAILRFGLDAGQVPTVVGPDGEEVEGDRGTVPWWVVDEAACYHLEDFSNAIRDACMKLAHADKEKRFVELIRQARDIGHDDGKHTWYATSLVRWEYLQRLDEMISQLKNAELDVVGHAEECNDEPSAPDEPKPESNGQTPAPKAYLTSWREILVTLKMTNNDEDREKVRQLNKTYGGPIMTPGRGSQPKAEKTDLIEWWNGLAAQWNTGGSRGRDAAATVQNQHDYGRSGTVVPDISGSVKRRRADRKG